MTVSFRRRLHASAWGLAPGLLVLALAKTSLAQSWVPQRTTPSLVELVSVDRTGEPNWLYGREDVAGDGLDTFTPAEQAIDVRTTYMVATNDDLWVRSYVSSPMAPGNDVQLFVFVDADRDPDTGGSAVAPEIDDRFDADPTIGGYEYVVGVRGDETVSGVWQWSTANEQYEPVMNVDATAESGVDFDPIWVNDGDHGYLQGRVELGALELDSTCNADFFVRSLNDDAALGDGDLDAGQIARCVRANAGGGQVPPPAVPPAACMTDDQCPGNGLCIDGDCVIPRGCRADADCAADERCDDNGYCVFDQSNVTCDDDAACVDLICDTTQSECVACQDDAECGADRRCASTGRCVDATDVATGTGGSGTGGAGTGASGTGGAGTGGIALADDEKIQGGAFTCAYSGAPNLAPFAHAAWGLLGGLFLFTRRAQRRKTAP